MTEDSEPVEFTAVPEPGGLGPWVLRPRVLHLDRGVHAVPGLDVPGALRRLAHRPGLIALDSVGGAPRRWSILGFDPFLDFATSPRAPRSLDDLERLLDGVRLDLASDVDLGPFGGGFLGALSYELGVADEPLELPPPVWPAPPIIGGLYGDWLVFEHGADGEPLGIRLVLSEGVGEGSAVERGEAVLRDLSSGPGTPPAPPAPAREIRRTVTSEEHCSRIQRAREEIARGEIYQANISHRMVAETGADALEIYLRLREVNPAPYMGFARFPMPGGLTGALLSASPELLLELGVDSSGRRVARTRPIKGTIGRGRTFLEDAALRAELLGSEKDRAELAMIVDLERNDLGRIAVPGGVEVLGFPTIETYASVHHLVADVRAHVRDDVSAIGVVASLFPGGSITGAPKLASMEVIAALEQEGRGYFTGSLGFIDARGHVALNILIRTLVHRTPAERGTRGEISFHVGGGITWRSDPDLEDAETLMKAEGLLRALRGAEERDLTSGEDAGTAPGGR